MRSAPRSKQKCLKHKLLHTSRKRVSTMKVFLRGCIVCLLLCACGYAQAEELPAPQTARGRQCLMSGGTVATWFDRLSRWGKSADQLIAELIGPPSAVAVMTRDIRRADDLRRSWPLPSTWAEMTKQLQEQILSDRARQLAERLAIQCMERSK